MCLNILTELGLARMLIIMSVVRQMSNDRGNFGGKAMTNSMGRLEIPVHWRPIRDSRFIAKYPCLFPSFDEMTILTFARWMRPHGRFGADFFSARS